MTLQKSTGRIKLRNPFFHSSRPCCHRRASSWGIPRAAVLLNGSELSQSSEWACTVASRGKSRLWFWFPSCCFSMRATCCLLFPCSTRSWIPQTRTSDLAEKVTKATWLAEDSARSLGPEDKAGGRGQPARAGRGCNRMVWLVVPLQAENQGSHWLSREWRGFCSELESDCSCLPQLAFPPLQKAFASLHQAFLC